MEMDLNIRDERVPVLFTPEEKREVAEAADRAGLKLSTYLRVKGLEAARRENADGKTKG